jgi:hypothetical protein
MTNKIYSALSCTELRMRQVKQQADPKDFIYSYVISLTDPHLHPCIYDVCACVHGFVFSNLTKFLGPLG